MARAVQGLGVGLATPLSMGIAVDKAPGGKTSTALGGIQAAFTLGLALGPIVEGLFAEHLDWRDFYLLLASVAIIAAAIVLVSY